MSIDNQIVTITSELSRIADALEKLIGIGTPAPGPGVSAFPLQVSTPPVPMPTPQAPAPGPVPMPTPQAPAPGPVPMPTPQAPAPEPISMPTAQPPGATLDAIRALANDFHRKHPDRATEIMTILQGVGAQKMDQIQPQFYQQVYDSIKALGA